MLFGDYADAENQAVFKVIAKRGTAYTNSEIKSVVAKKVNEYFNLDNWDFGDQFYFSELAAYLHQELSDYISSVVITPKYSGNDFKNLLSINCEPHEIFLSVVTSKDVKIISSIADNELTGE
jgi:transcriptional regulator of heat shock response